jgi:hypothetical protein
LLHFFADTGQKKTLDKKDGRRMSFQKPKGTLEYTVSYLLWEKQFIFEMVLIKVFSGCTTKKAKIANCFTLKTSTSSWTFI